MEEIIIDEEFKSLLPALDKKTYALLEDHLLSNGCLHPLVLWNNILIDGHNRYEICTKNGIPFTTVSMEFISREGVVIWIISAQIARRNLNPIQLSYYRGLHYRSAKRIQGAHCQLSNESEKSQNGTFKESTANHLAKEYKVSRNTILRDAHVADAIDAIGETSPEAKRRILSGETGITRKHLNELLVGSEEDIVETASKIGEGTYEKKKHVNPPTVEEDNLNDPAVEEMCPMSADVIKLSEDFISSVHRFSKESDVAGLKMIIKFYIIALEELYEQM